MFLECQQWFSMATIIFDKWFAHGFFIIIIADGT
jgi:hypothetical protein